MIHYSSSVHNGTVNYSMQQNSQQPHTEKLNGLVAGTKYTITVTVHYMDGKKLKRSQTTTTKGGSKYKQLRVMTCKQSHESGYLLFSQSVDITVTDIKSTRVWYTISGQPGSQYTCTVGNTSVNTTAGAQVSTPDLDPNTNYTIKCTATENSCLTAKTIQTGM